MKPRMTIEEHVELGRHLASMRGELLSCQVQLGNAYPRSGTEAVPARKLEVAVRAIDEARTELENAMYREHPQMARTSTYYPQTEDLGRSVGPRGR